MADIRTMKFGQLMDFCLAYNERQEKAEREAKREESGRRKATEADIVGFFGK